MADTLWTCDVCGRSLVEHQPSMDIACAVSLVRRLDRAESRVAVLDEQVERLSTSQRCAECGSSSGTALLGDGFWYCKDAQACRERRITRKLQAVADNTGEPSEEA